MKELIRHILKEETTDLNNEKKGIDLAIKLLKKSYPYIVGWKYDAFYKSLNSIQINIICDIEKLQEFYNSEVKEYYKKNEDMLTDGFPYAASVLNIYYDMSNQEKYEEYQALKDELNDIYEMLPDELVPKDDWNDIKKIDPNDFYFK